MSGKLILWKGRERLCCAIEETVLEDPGPGIPVMEMGCNEDLGGIFEPWPEALLR
jgi:hypothetical protein